MSQLTYEPYTQKSFVVRATDETKERFHAQFRNIPNCKWHTKLKGGGTGWLIPVESEDKLKEILRESELLQMKSHAKPRQIQKKYHRATSDTEDAMVEYCHTFAKSPSFGSPSQSQSESGDSEEFPNPEEDMIPPKHKHKPVSVSPQPKPRYEKSPTQRRQYKEERERQKPKYDESPPVHRHERYYEEPRRYRHDHEVPHRREHRNYESQHYRPYRARYDYDEDRHDREYPSRDIVHSLSEQIRELQAQLSSIEKRRR